MFYYSHILIFVCLFKKRKQSCCFFFNNLDFMVYNYPFEILKHVSIEVLMRLVFFPTGDRTFDLQLLSNHYTIKVSQFRTS